MVRKFFNIELDSTTKGMTDTYFQTYEGDNLVNEIPIKSFRGNLEKDFTNIGFSSREKAKKIANKIMKIKTINQLKKVI